MSVMNQLWIRVARANQHIVQRRVNRLITEQAPVFWLPTINALLFYQMSSMRFTIVRAYVRTLIFTFHSCSRFNQPTIFLISKNNIWHRIEITHADTFIVRFLKLEIFFNEQGIATFGSKMTEGTQQRLTIRPRLTLCRQCKFLGNFNQ